MRQDAATLRGRGDPHVEPRGGRVRALTNAWSDEPQAIERTWTGAAHHIRRLRAAG